MKLTLQKRLAATRFKSGKSRIKCNPEQLKDIKEALTAADVRRLIKSGAIHVEQKQGSSKSRARNIKLQKSKGRRQGKGSRKGSRTARLPRKQAWMLKIRVQRKFLKLLYKKQLLTSSIYRNLYRKAKSGMFRSKRHLRTYITEQQLIQQLIQDGKK